MFSGVSKEPKRVFVASITLKEMIVFVGGLSAGLHTVSVLWVTAHEKAAWIGVFV